MARPVPSGSQSDLAAFVDRMCLYCELQAITSGDTLRVKGQHYRDMYLITHGECAVDLDPDSPSSTPITRGPGQPIGEIGFLRGMAATATVTALEQMQVMVIDDETIAIIEDREPALIADLLQRLSGIADDRTSYNLTQTESSASHATPSDTEILLCRSATMEQQARRLRYEVYCEELGLQPKSANHRKRTISDARDAFANSFIALQGGEAVGTIRINFPRDGSLGSLERLYGMSRSQHHPDATALTSMFVVKRRFRNTPVAMQLISHAAQFALNHGIGECFMDCVPELYPYYRAVGFTRAEEDFFHPEHGPSVPMRIDLERYGKDLARTEGWGRKIALYAKKKAYKLSDTFRS